LEKRKKGKRNEREGGKIENISVLLIFYHGKKNRGRKERTFN
jgi:hypothetical protein